MSAPQQALPLETALTDGRLLVGQGDGQRLQNLLEQTSDWIWEVDAEGRYIYSNGRVAEILGYRPEEVIGRTPFDFMPPEEAARLRRLFNELARRRVPFARLENVNLHKDGHAVVLETSGVPVIDEQGHLCGYRGIDRDITDRRRTEEALENAHRSLEQRVRERTRSLAKVNARLEHMLETHRRLVVELQRAEQSKSHFLAAASHDLRQPYQGALLMIEALRARLKDPSDRLLADRAVEALEAGRGVLDSLARVSALDAGIVEVCRVPVRVGEITARAVADQAAMAAEKKIALRHVSCGAMVASDPALVSLAVGQYISNALYHAAATRVLVGCRRRPGHVRIEVWDNGRGLEEAHLREVFDDFVQIGNPERDRRKGLGLGLGLVSRIGRLLGLAVGARSWPGRGSVFHISVPLA